MRVYKILLALLLVFATHSPASAEPPSGFEPTERIAFPGECYGRTDSPHISMHVPGTVNALARTYCPKTGVSISSRLVRTYQGVMLEKTVSSKGFGLVTINISMKCIWKKGEPEVKYTIYSKHLLTNGRSGETKQSASLKC